IPRLADRRAVPLSFGQERLWFLDQTVPEKSAFNVPRAIRFVGEVDQRALQQALDALVARHEILRTSYRATHGIPYQFVAEPQPVAMNCQDLRIVPAADRDAQFRRILLEESRRPFNLSADQLLRATWLRLNERDFCLLLMTHHIASDGWSKA